MIILKSINPIEISDNPSPEVVQFAEKWITSPPVLALKAYLSPLLKIPPEGFDITSCLGKNYDDLQVFNNPLVSMLTVSLPQSLLAKYNLTGVWIKFFLLSAYFNVVVDVVTNPGFLDGFPITFAVGKKAISSKLFDLGEDEAIGLLLPFHSSKSRVHKWIDDHWTEIETAMDHNFVKDVPLLSVMKNWSLGKEIEELKQAKNTYKQIAVIMTDKYPDDERLCDLDQIKKIHKRYLDSKSSFDPGFVRLLSLVGDK